MGRTLRSEGLIQRGLFRVEGELVSHYNRALEAAVGRETTLTEFHLDKRGESPEIEEELGWNYLQRSRSDRYLIIVSPDQGGADLIHEEFSFDDDIIGFLYDHYIPTISVVTRVDGLWGELDDGVRVMKQMEDLLLLQRIQVALKAPSEFIAKARKLQSSVRSLQRNPDLLVKDDSAVLRRIHRLARQVGDVRNYNITHPAASWEVGSFFTRLYGGVTVFREGFESLPIHRPDEAPRSNGGEEHPGPRAVVIHAETNHEPIDAPAATFLSLSDTERVVDFLLENGHAVFAEELVESRLTQLENEALAASGRLRDGMGEDARRQALAELGDAMPEGWKALLEIKRRTALGHAFQTVLRKQKTQVRSMLMQATEGEGRPAKVVKNLLTKLWPWDYAMTYRFNRHDLERIFEEAPPWKQDHIVRVLRREQAGER
jgi:hypothetical protein